jgi:orotidine-5'-phosphate decarboxylase
LTAICPVIPSEVEESLTLPLDMTKAADKIIVALDVPSKKEALELVVQLREQLTFFKIGLQLFTAAGPGLVREIVATGLSVFLDLKLHDIPNTVAGAVRAAGELSVRMLTVHLSGGRAMLEAAIDAKPPNMELLGVTVLTSLDSAALHLTGVKSNVEDQVRLLSNIGRTAGITGFVASAHEAKQLRREFPESTIVTPGIRPGWSSGDDQRRSATPREAIENGADYLVIGRPIIADANPQEAAQRILDEVSA